MRTLARVMLAPVAIVLGVLPRRYWDRLSWMPLRTMAFPSAVATSVVGLLVGLYGLAAYSMAARTGNHALFLYAAQYVPEGQAGQGVGLLTLLAFALATPTGWLTNYLLVSGGVRAVAVVLREPFGDPLLTVIDLVLRSRRHQGREAAARSKREREEGPPAPDRLGDGFDVEMPQGLRAAYPLTPTQPNEVTAPLGAIHAAAAAASAGRLQASPVGPAAALLVAFSHAGPTCATMCYMASAGSKTVGVRELRQNLSVHLDRVKEGCTLTVTEHGRAVAELRPLPPESESARSPHRGRPADATAPLAASLAAPVAPGARPAGLCAARRVSRGFHLTTRRYAYLDASALVKLAVREPETTALERAILDCDALFTSEVGAVELRRALGRTGHPAAAELAETVIDAVFLANLTPAIGAQAGRLQPASLRTLDAIHVATAASLALADLEFITYDERQATAARALGLRVLQPGRP